MTTPAIQKMQDMDSLHILPLSIIPLKTAGLRRARLVKNAQMEGVVELFSDDRSGSGQIPAKHLDRVFEFDETNFRDQVIVTKLADLPSYDVYSLRISLRELGIDVNNEASLRISPERYMELVSYMRVFTRPLLGRVYGDNQVVGEFHDILRLFSDPERANARRNLNALAQRLDIDMLSIPGFIEDYGDTYLSLAYYQQCLDTILPSLSIFLRAARRLQKDDTVKRDMVLAAACTLVEARLAVAARQVANTLEIFRKRTENMWEDITGTGFREIKTLISEYHMAIGANLCTVTVKVNAWRHEFRTVDQSNVYRLARFIAQDMQQGIDKIQPIELLGEDIIKSTAAPARSGRA